MRQLSPARVIFFPSAMNRGFSPSANELLVPLDLKSAGSDARKARFRCVFGWNPRQGLSPFEAFRPRGCRTIITTAFYDELRRPGIIARFLWDGIIAGPSNRRWTILSSGDCASGRIDFAALLRSPAAPGVEVLAEYFGVSLNENAEEVASWQGFNRTWPIAEVWRKLTENVVIPYNLSRRRRGYARAYDKLDSTIRYCEGLRKERTDNKRGR